MTTVTTTRKMKRTTQKSVYTISELMSFRGNAPVLDDITQQSILDLLASTMLKKKERIVDALNKIVKQNASSITRHIENVMHEQPIELYDFLAESMFKKAIQEQMFVDCNTEVVKQLNYDLTVPPRDGKSCSFKYMIIRKCQNLFQHGLDELNQLMVKKPREDEIAEYNEQVYKKKNNYFGVVLFIAELYKQHMIPVNVIVKSCLKQLLNKLRGDHDYTCIEPIFKLLKSAGAQLEKDKHQDSCGKTLDELYNHLSAIKDDPLIGKRNSFMIVEILESRQTWIHEAEASNISSSSVVIKSLDITTNSNAPLAQETPEEVEVSSEPPPESKLSVQDAKNHINSSLDEYIENKNCEELYMDFDQALIKNGYSYMLIPSVFNYCVEKNLSETDTEKITSVLSEYGAFTSSKHDDLAKGVEELLTVLGDMEDVTEKVISQFSMFMSIVLCHLNFCILSEFVNCLYNLRDYDPFCSLKEKKKYGVSALYFVGTLSAVKKVDPEQAKAMSSKAKDSPKIFNNEEQRKTLYEMYDISTFL